jgi:hypothetical protein
VRQICRSAVVPLEIRLPRRAPNDIEPYRALFRCPLRFDAPEGAVIFRSETLRRRLPARATHVEIRPRTYSKAARSSCYP